MDEIENEHIDRLFERMREEHRRDRRQVEKTSGVTLIIISLIMAVTFLAALVYSGNSLLVQAISIISLIIAVGLFGRGLQYALMGRR